jgi:hypothetical protein
LRQHWSEVMVLTVTRHEQRTDGGGISAILHRVTADEGGQFRALFFHVGIQRGLKVIE